MNIPEFFFWPSCPNFSVRVLKFILTYRVCPRKLSIEIELKNTLSSFIVDDEAEAKFEIII